ncbi:MAG TPA: DUF3108 domain-containing protein [Bacteroidales bacterium]|nr:DUF3108 domain-containing protein [Bacteroidales bacterium]
MRVLLATCLILLLPLSLNAQSNQNNFKSGEKLRFVIYYGPLDGGYIDAQLEEAYLDGKPVYHSKMLAKSTGLADKLYKVRDEYQSYFDPYTLLPYKSIRNIREGKYTKFNIVYYNHADLKVTNVDNKVFDVPPDIRDMVSVFYYIRNRDFDNMKNGDIIKINTFFDNEIFPFDMRYRGREVIKTRMGTYRCIKLVPFVEPGRIFNDEDDMTIWLSDDSNRVPIRVSFDLKVGSIKCDLIEYSGLKY